MEITFYTEKEYRKFIRSLSKKASFRTLSKSLEYPVRLYVPFNSAYGVGES